MQGMLPSGGGVEGTGRVSRSCVCPEDARRAMASADHGPRYTRAQQNFQRFPHSLQTTKVVMGSSELRVCTCV